MNISPIILFAFASGITPGPNNTLLLHSGARHGYVRSLPHIFGIVGGMCPLFLLVGMGLGEFIAASPIASIYLHILSGLYIAYLSFRIANSPFPGHSNPRSDQPWSFFQAAGFQWMNPKVWMMATGVFGSGMGGGAGWPRILAVTAIFALVCFPTMSIWTAFGAKLRPLLLHRIHFRILHVGLGGLLATCWFL